MKNQSLPESKLVSEFWEIITGYQRARVLFAFAELHIAKVLDGVSLSAHEVANKTKIHPLAMERFLNACVNIGLLQRDNSQFSNTHLAAVFLHQDADFYLGGICRRHAESGYEVWGNLTEKLKNWEYGETAESNPADEDQGADAMIEQHKLALLNGFALASAFNFSGHKKILDLGGGTGATSIALCQTYPNLESIVFDLPANAEITREFVEKENLQERIQIISGNFQKDALPDGYDLALLANFMSVADAETNRILLRRIYEKLPVNGGACLLSGWIVDDTHLSPPVSVLFCLEDICRDAPDVERSESTYSEWLTGAGFKNIRGETYLYPTKFLCGFKI